MKIDIYDITKQTNNYIYFSRYIWTNGLVITEPSFYSTNKLINSFIYCRHIKVLNDLDEVIGGKSYLTRYRYFT